MYEIGSGWREGNRDAALRVFAEMGDVKAIKVPGSSKTEFVRGAILEIELGPEPNKEWGLRRADNIAEDK